MPHRCNKRHKNNIYYTCLLYTSSQISDSKHIDTYVSGGRYGVSRLGSSMDGDDVSLKAKYKVKLPVSFFTVDGIWIEDYSNSRK